MSIKTRIAGEQPDSFKFSRENEAEIRRIIAKYPKGRQASAVMPLLDLAIREERLVAAARDTSTTRVSIRRGGSSV